MILPTLLDDPIRKSYLRKVLSVEKANLIGLWLQKEASGSICYDFSGNDHHGTYVNTTLGQQGVPGMGYTCPLYDNDDCYIDIYSAELAAAFSGAEGTLLAWGKVYDVDVWEDDTARRLVQLQVNASNYIFIERNSADNKIQFQYVAGGTAETQLTAGLSNIDFACYGITWSKSGDIVNYFIAGALSGSPDTGLGTWAGSLASANTVIGAYSTGAVAPWYGYIAPVALWSKALTVTQIAYLS